MNRPPEDDRSAISVAYAWATRVMVIAAEMVIAGLAGSVDRSKDRHVVHVLRWLVSRLEPRSR